MTRARLLTFASLGLALTSMAGGCGGCDTPPPEVGPPDLEPVAFEVCSGGEDEDGDGLTDCGDPYCRAAPECLGEPVDPGVMMGGAGAGSIDDDARRLFASDPPAQRDVDPAAFEGRALALVRGQALDSDGEPLGRVRVHARGRAELGYTLTRDDGFFDLAAFGGERLTLRFERLGAPEVDRVVTTRPGGWSVLEPVVLTTREVASTPVDLDREFSVVRTERVEDGDGAREGTLMFEGGTRATLTLPDGSTETLSAVHVRTVEYTVGEDGPRAMPGELPPTSLYTYAAEFSLDEARQRGATRVSFSKPVVFYQDNFAGLRVGAVAPLGFYDPQTSQWVPERNGRVVSVLANDGARVTLDVDGDGIAATDAQLSELGVGARELEELAAIYAPGDELWRVELDHFSAHDVNWPGRGSDNEDPAGGGDFATGGPGCAMRGSIVLCDSRGVVEHVQVPGAPFSLVYRSDRARGRNHTLHVDLVPQDEPPVDLRGVRLVVEVAGRRHEEIFEAAPNLSTVFEWDGRDAFGREVTGRTQAIVRITYLYQECYAEPAPLDEAFGAAADRGVSVQPNGNTFGVAGPCSSVSSRLPSFSEVVSTGFLGDTGVEDLGLGGWTLSTQHLWRPEERRVYRGDGRSRYGEARVLETLDDGLDAPGGPLALEGGVTEAKMMGIEAVGDQLFMVVVHSTDSGLGGLAVWRRAPTGAWDVVAGQASPRVDAVIACLTEGRCGDGGPSTDAFILPTPTLGAGVEVSADARTIYVMEANCVRRFIVDGDASTVFGACAGDASGGEEDLFDGAPHADAFLQPFDIAVGPLNELYVLLERAIWRVDGDRAQRVLGTRDAAEADVGLSEVEGGWPTARRVQLDAPILSPGLTVGPDSTLYFNRFDRNGLHQVFAIPPNGSLVHVAGSLDSSARNAPFIEGSSPKDIALDDQVHLTFDARGDLYRLFADRERFDRLARISLEDDEVTLALGPARTSEFLRLSNQEYRDRYLTRDPVSTRRALLFPAGAQSFTIGGDGALIVATHPDNLSERIVLRRTRLLIAPEPGEATVIPSEDGGELWSFDATGRHLSTQDAFLGHDLVRFGYDDAGRVTSVTDRFGDTTTIERDASGAPTSITSPEGLVTTLELDDSNHLARVELPDGQTYRMTYDEGVITSFEDARGETTTMEWDDAFRLDRETDPTGAALVFQDVGADVEVTTRGGRTRVFSEEGVTNTDGFTNEIVSDTVETFTRRPDGTLQLWITELDPRFGSLVEYTSDYAISVPGAGLQREVATTRDVELDDPSDPRTVSRDTTTITVNEDPPTRIVRDSGARTIETTSSEGRATTRTFDPLGLLTEYAVDGLTPMTYERNPHGMVTRITHGDRTQTISYSDDLLTSTHTGQPGGEVVLRRSARGLISERLVDGERAVLLERDGRGNVTAVEDAAGGRWLFRYDGANRLIGVTEPGATEITRVPDPDGMASEMIFEDGRTLRMEPDANDRVGTIISDDERAEFTYDDEGQLVSVTDQDGDAVSFENNGVLLTAVTTSGAVNVRTEYTYSNKLVVDSIKVGDGPARPQEYDADGILTRTGDLRLTNHPGFGGPERLEVASTTVDVSYTPQGEWRAWSASYPGGAFGWELEFEPTGAIGAATVDGVREVYTIDAHAQLTTVTRDGALAERYGYDPRGNRTSVEVGGAQEVATFDARNRILTQGAVTYTHDEAGYRTARQAPEGRTEYVYDTVGALRSVSLPTGQTVTYGTDPMGRRLTRSVDGQRTGGYVWAEATRLLATTDAAGEVDATFGYGTNPYVPDVVYTPTRTLILLKDHVQSVREVVDADTGEVLQRMDYDAFGRLLLDTNPGLQPFGFAGGLHDPLTGLTRFGVRDYDPETGRFTARDPIGFAGGDTNTYRYALNQPHHLSDPTGHAFWVPIIATAVISGALSTGVYGFLYYTAPEYPTKAGVCTRADFSLGGAAVWFAAGFAAGAIGAYAAAAAGTLVLAEGAVLSTKLAYVFAQSSITALGGAFGGAVSETIKVVGDPRVTFDMGSLGWSMVGGAIAGGITGGISSVGSTFQAFGMSSATQPYNPEAYGVMDGILDIIGAPFGDSISGTF